MILEILGQRIEVADPAPGGFVKSEPTPNERRLLEQADRVAVTVRADSVVPTPYEGPITFKFNDGAEITVHGTVTREGDHEAG